MTSFVSRLVFPVAVQRPIRRGSRLAPAALDVPTAATAHTLHRHDRAHVADARRMREDAVAGLFPRFL